MSAAAMSPMSLLGALLFVLALLLLVPACVLFVEVLFGAPARRDPAPPGTGRRPRVAILTPAHNEAAGIAATVQALRAQMADGDRLLVVADNCSDDTALLARGAGAEVAERRDAHRRGKGYALAFGVDLLAAQPPDVVAIVDADCRLEPGSLDRLARACADSGLPAQAINLSRAPAGSGLKPRLLEFASVVKNEARALGYHRLGLPCQLTGTGMAFPWRVIRAAPLATGHIVEDLQLGLDLTLAGTPPRLCPGARVNSFFPSDASGLATQRTRWEHGHVATMARAPGLLWRALLARHVGLAALALDLCVPPQAFLALGLSATVVLTAVFAAAGGTALPLQVALVALALMVGSVLIPWWRFGRGIVSGREMLALPFYVMSKIPMVVRVLTKRQTEWVRTKRDAADK